MSWRLLAVAPGLLLAACVPDPGPPAAGGATPLPVAAVCFAPRMDCAGLIADQIGSARRELLIQAYGFTDPRIGAAILAAHARGVAVTVILDRSNRADRRSLAPLLAGGGIPVRVDARVAIAHNKVMIIDGTRVITGSYNFTRAAASRNAENLIVVEDAATVAQYRANFDSRLAGSVPLDTVAAVHRHRSRSASGS